MKKDGLVLVFTIILLCAAAVAVEAAGALTDPSGKGGNVEAPFVRGSQKNIASCFVEDSDYSDLIKDKKQLDFDPSVIHFEGSAVPCDGLTGTVYIPQSLSSSAWEGIISASEPYSDFYIFCEGEADKSTCIEEGTSFKMALVSEKSFMECSLVFTGLPAVIMTNGEDKIENGAEYTGTICVLDPYREEFQEAVCTFHIRGATSTLFDKKSYRVELQETAEGSDKLSFLGLRKDDDWILNSLCTDSSLAREKVCYDLWKRLNEMEEQPVPSSEIEYCELFLNNEYLGVYGLMYPVDRKLMGMKPGDLLYKVKAWYEEMDITGSLTDHNGETEIFNRNGTSYLELKYPKDAGACIYDPFEKYQEMIFETGDMADLEKAGITLDKENYILHELFCEMTRAGDNTWKNLFIAAYSDGKGGYTFNETIWDLNYTFGDQFTWDPDRGNTVFLPDSVNKYKLRYDRDYAYARLELCVDGIRDDTAEKWKKWRLEGIGADYINSLFEEERKYLSQSGAFERNAVKWNAADMEDAYSGISEWIYGRFEFLDEIYGFNGTRK